MVNKRKTYKVCVSALLIDEGLSNHLIGTDKKRQKAKQKNE